MDWRSTRPNSRPTILPRNGSKWPSSPSAARWNWPVRSPLPISSVRPACRPEARPHWAAPSTGRPTWCNSDGDSTGSTACRHSGPGSFSSRMGGRRTNGSRRPGVRQGEASGGPLPRRRRRGGRLRRVQELTGRPAHRLNGLCFRAVPLALAVATIGVAIAPGSGSRIPFANPAGPGGWAL